MRSASSESRRLLQDGVAPRMKNTSEPAEERQGLLEPPVDRVKIFERAAVAVNLGGIAEAEPFVP